ncbi:HXXEE domain-containing protein [Paenibacillus sp. 1011MAR3C5]|uniref:HXXEE domain-containing protein n=1 Tax=Paenibacillus sp. 1011MAR3C5 TaxID=1675787 RepID=UPI000E6BA827|nr:HXXEE domain-containing protein [Paenibacillus sp. 1011MAR3C5]RJE89701.1 HXXEE domain-containing protein [Paenibacillus sp. 1011MAR3C5]
MLSDTIIHLEFLMWLFLVVFFLHDGEEIVTMERWVRKHHKQAKLALDLRLIDLNKNLTVQFTAGVLTIGVALALVTYVAVPLAGSKHALYALFTGLVAVFLLDGLKHIGISLLLKTYTPGVVTAAVLEVPYGAYALYRLFDEGMLNAIILLKGTVMALPLVLMLGASGLLLGGRIAPRRSRS